MPVPIRTINEALKNSLTYWSDYTLTQLVDAGGNSAPIKWLVQNASIIGNNINKIHMQLLDEFQIQEWSQETEIENQINLGTGVAFHDGIGLSLFGRSVDFEIDMNDYFRYTRRDFEAADVPPVVNQEAKGMTPTYLGDTGSFREVITDVGWWDLESKFAAGRSSEGDGFMNAYLIRMVMSGSPQDIKDAVLKAKEITELTEGLVWKDFDEENKPYEIAEFYSQLEGN